MENPLITLAVVSHNQQNLVESLFRSLVEVNPGVEFQVVLVENVKGGQRIDFNQFDFPIRFVENAVPLGYSSNLNKAFELGGRLTDYFCILNPDIRFSSDIFIDLIEAIREEKTDVISPLVVDTSGEIQDSFRPLPTFLELILRFIGVKKYRYTYDELPEFSHPDWIAAMFLLMPSSVYDDLNGFDPRYRLYFEDVDFCVRARQQGYQIAVKKTTQVIHDAQRESHKNFLLFRYHFVSAIKFFVSKVYWREKRINSKF